MGDASLAAPSGRFRPRAVLIQGDWREGLEIELDEGRISAIRASSRRPDPWVMSPAFTNAHSHLEYRGFEGSIAAREYWPWIRELTRRKSTQTLEEVRRDCHLAAAENRRAGVELIFEHSDRPGATEALRSESIHGRIGYEVITLGRPDTRAKLAEVRARASADAWPDSAAVPHATYTVSPGTLSLLARTEPWLSVHVAESRHEKEFFERGSGPIADLLASLGETPPEVGQGVLRFAESWGLAKRGAQWVHCCELSADEMQRIATLGVNLAHCPRSNENLGCRPAQVRAFLAGGGSAGLGTDSAASAGPPNLFAEMRAALAVSRSLGEPLAPEQVWHMACEMGAKTVGVDRSFEIDRVLPLVRIRTSASSLEELIQAANPEDVLWLSNQT